MTASLRVIATGNWDSDLVTVEHGRKDARKRVTLRRGDSLEIHPPYEDEGDEEAHTIRFHAHTDKNLEEVHYRGPVQVWTADPPGDGHHPKRVKS